MLDGELGGFVAGGGEVVVAEGGEDGVGVDFAFEFDGEALRFFVLLFEVGDGAFKGDFAVVDGDDTVANSLDVGKDVGGENDGGAAFKLAEDVEDFLAAGGVEGGSGLIANEELRLAEEGLGDAETLLHAAGKTADLFVGF